MLRFGNLGKITPNNLMSQSYGIYVYSVRAIDALRNLRFAVESEAFSKISTPEEFKNFFNPFVKAIKEGGKNHALTFNNVKSRVAISSSIFTDRYILDNELIPRNDAAKDVVSDSEEVVVSDTADLVSACSDEHNNNNYHCTYDCNKIVMFDKKLLLMDAIYNKMNELSECDDGTLNDYWYDVVVAAFEKLYTDNGIIVNGIKYVEFTEAAAYLKEDVAIFVSEDVMKRMEKSINFIKSLSEKVGDKSNIFKHKQYLAVPTSSSVIQRHTGKIGILDIKDPFYNNGFFANTVFPEAAVSKNGFFNYAADEGVVFPDEPTDVTDGIAILIAEHFGMEYAGCSAQIRSELAIKAFGIYWPIEKIKEAYRNHDVSDDHFMIKVADDDKLHDISEYAILVTKDSFKYYPQYMEYHKETGLGIESFIEELGGDPSILYINHFNKRVDMMTSEEKNKYYNGGIAFGKQAMGLVDFSSTEGEKALKAIAKRDIEHQKEFMSRTYEEAFAAYADGLGSQKKLSYFTSSADVVDDNGRRAYRFADTANNILSCKEFFVDYNEAYVSYSRKMSQGATIDGLMLPIHPDAMQVFNVIFRTTEMESLCDSKNGHHDVYCKDMKDGNVLMYRYPVQGNALHVANNRYRDCWFNEFLPSNVMFIGWMSVSYLQMAADCDGDHVMATQLQELIDAVIATNEKVSLPLIAFKSIDCSKSDAPVANEFRTFKAATEDFYKTSANACANAYKNNLVGNKSAISSCINEEIMSMVAHGRVLEAEQTYIKDLCPVVQEMQLAVDAQKRGAYIGWDHNDSYLNHLSVKNKAKTLWHDNSHSMVAASFKKKSKIRREDTTFDGKRDFNGYDQYEVEEKYDFDSEGYINMGSVAAPDGSVYRYLNYIFSKFTGIPYTLYYTFVNDSVNENVPAKDKTNRTSLRLTKAGKEFLKDREFNKGSFSLSKNWKEVVLPSRTTNVFISSTVVRYIIEKYASETYRNYKNKYSKFDEDKIVSMPVYKDKVGENGEHHADGICVYRLLGYIWAGYNKDIPFSEKLDDTIKLRQSVENSIEERKNDIDRAFASKPEDQQKFKPNENTLYEGLYSLVIDDKLCGLSMTYARFANMFYDKLESAWWSNRRLFSIDGNLKDVSKKDGE